MAVFAVLLVSVASSAVTARMRQEFFYKIMNFSLEEVAKFTTPSLITRCTFHVIQIQLFISYAPAVLTRTLLMGVIASAGIFSKNIIWTSITGGSIALMLFLFTYLIIFLTPSTMRLNKITDKLNKISLEHLTGCRVIHAYNAQDYQQKKFDGVNNSLADTNIYINNRITLTYPAVTLFTNITFLMIYFSGIFILQSVGKSQNLPAFSDMIAALSYAGLAIYAFSMLSILSSNDSERHSLIKTN